MTGVGALHHGAPHALKAFASMSTAATASNAIDTKIKELMALAIGIAEGGGALVIDDVTGETGEDRGQSCPPWPVRHVPIGRGSGAEGTVPENPEPD